jgi:hypothetical protein
MWRRVMLASDAAGFFCGNGACAKGTFAEPAR